MRVTAPRRKPVARGKAQRLEKHTLKRQRILELIQAWADVHGEPPRVNDWRHVKDTPWPSYITVIRYWGSWDEAIMRAGFNPRGRGRPVEDI